MGGGVSKREFDRITKELIIKDQVIRTLQERLANGSLESFSNDAADAHGMSSMMRKKDDRRVSLAELVPGPLSQRLDSVNTFHYEAKEALYEGTTQSKLDARSHNGLRDDEKVSSGQHDLIFSDGKSRRAEVSADVMPSRKIMATNERVVYPKGEKSRQLLLTILQSNVLFQGQSHGEIQDCLNAFLPMRIDPGHVVIKQGAQGDNFYAVETGQLEILVSTGDAPPIRYGFLGPGLGFGELALLYNMPRAATIRAVTEADLWAIERNTFREILASHKLNRLNRTLQVLQKIELLNKLTMSELQHVAAAMDWEEFEENAVIVRQGEVGEKFYIINKGEIVVKQVDVNTGVDNVIRKLKAGDHFGEMALFRDEMRSATCIATTRVQCITLERAHFIAMLGTLQELMDREPVCLESCDQADKRTITEELHEAAEYKYYKSISRDELEVLQTLGRGAFGRVRLVRHAASNRAYALKCLIKSHIVMNNLKEHVLNEKLVMLSLDHPFILKLYSTFKDQTHIYFLIELALGGELFTYLRRTDHFKESVARFYIASVVLVFQHMHSKSIIYRDLKPENILLDNQGYMKLADFGLAKVVTDRTWTLCGTPDYLAPEIILNKGHDKAVDYWALGILIFELMTGSAPFCARDPMQTYTLIIQGNVKFPTFTSRTCVDLVQKLLCQNPARRLGNMKHGMDDIINHRWFSKFDWDGLASKSMKPPIIPQVLDDFDTSNFEDFRNEVEDPGGECDWDPDF